MTPLRLCITSIALATSLFGCATLKAPPPPNPTVACFAEIANAPELQPIAGKLTFVGRASLPMVSDPDRPTQAQQPAIQAAEARYSACIEIGASWRRQFTPPEVESAGMRSVRDRQAALALLYRGEISFGQYNTHSNALRADLEQRMNDIRAVRQQQLDEFQRKEAIARIMAPPPPVMQYAPIKPTSTTCRAELNTVVCDTM